MRGDRLISIILSLQTHGRMTAQALAEKLEVSERTIYRDMDALSRSGIPVIAARGTNGGWSLLDDFQTNLTGLKESEIRALFVSPSAQLLEDLGFTKVSEAARNKLIASLPSSFRENAKDVWNRIHIDTSTWRNRKEKVKAFELLKEALWKNNKIKMVYQRADGQTNERIVNPLGLVAKGSRWYLIATKENGEIRNYRAARIQSAEALAESFERPKSFDLAQYWRSSTQAFIENLPSFNVRVEVNPSILPVLQFNGHFSRIVETGKQNANGWIPLHLTFESEDEAIRYVLGFADEMKVIEPRDLRDQIMQTAQSTVAFYKRESLH